MKKVFRYLKKIDIFLLLLCVLACGFSVILLYSLYRNDISAYVYERHYKMQIITSAVGIVGALILTGINYKFLSKIWFIYAPISLISVLLLFTPLGISVAGADDINWLDLGFTAIQPSEFMKIAFILTFSTHISKLGTKLNSIPHLFLLLIHGMFPVALISVLGDDGTALVFLFMFITMLFTAGLWWRYIIAAVAVVPVGIYVAWNYLMQSHHKLRFLVLFDEEVQATSSIYDQQRAGLTAIGSGQLTGKGLLGGDYTYVPALETDFIFAYIGMTLGFIGSLAIVVLLVAIMFKILQNALSAKDLLGKEICIGVFAMFFFHTVINIGMALGVAPVIGIPLPFFSAGGSSMMSTMFCMGLVMSVRGHREKTHHMFYSEKD